MQNTRYSKVGALLLAFALMIGMFAGIPSAYAQSIPTATITAMNIAEEGVAVTAYQIVEGIYQNGSLEGYKTVGDITIDDITAPTAEEIAAISVEGLTAIQMVNDGSGNYQANVEPGMYLILVSGADTTVYNPAIVSVNVSDAGLGEGSLTAGSVDMETFFQEGQTNVYMKSTEVDMNKVIVGDPEDVKGDTVAVGDIVNFKITTNLPSYSGEYVNPVFTITDKLNPSSFGEIQNVVVEVNGAVLEATGNYALEMDADNKGFVVSFTEAYLRSMASAAPSPEVVVTYTSTILEGALIVDPNTNTATLRYSNDPTDETSVKDIIDETFHYTFEIELNKHNEEGNPLAGAVFGLYDENNVPYQRDDAHYTITSGADGKVVFSGLDVGTYYIREMTAPTGYNLNPINLRAIVSAVIAADGTLTSHEVQMAQEDDEGNFTPITYPADVVNTPLSELPSTGGEGTMIMMIAAAALAGVFGIVMAVAKRKEKQLSNE